MRADMFKVIVERPRWGAGHARSVKLKRSRNDLKAVGLKRHAALEAPYTKSLSENLGPLLRFLRSRRGRRWDDVFSEICERLDTGSAVKMHVRMHIEDFVMIGIVRGRYGELIHDGAILGAPCFRFRRRPFFVDPDDGILKDMAVLGARLARPAKERGR